MLRSKIREEFLSAVKARAGQRADALRSIEAALKQVEVDTRRELSDDDVLKLLRSEAKKREESIELYHRGNRQDLVDKETYELDLIRAYMPAQMPKEEIEKLVDQARSELGDSPNFGQLMQKTMALVAGKADGKMVSEVVRSKML